MNACGERIRKVLGAALGVAEDRITDETGPETVAAWDSVMHLNLVLALEEEFGTAFSAEETLEMTSVARIRRLLEAKGICGG
jgi:acyl carrier protein